MHRKWDGYAPCSETGTDATTGTIWPAAAVIPAPIAYVKVAAVKKLVVGFRNTRVAATPSGVCLDPSFLSFGDAALSVRSEGSGVPISLL